MHDLTAALGEVLDGGLAAVHLLVDGELVGGAGHCQLHHVVVLVLSTESAGLLLPRGLSGVRGVGEILGIGEGKDRTRGGR